MYSSFKGHLIGVILLLISMSSAWAQSCSIPGQAGTVINLNSQPNTFFPGTASPSIGATSITVGASRGVNRAIEAGDLLLIIQMQGADINSSNTNAYGNNTSDAGTATVAFGATGYAGGVNGTNFVAGNYEWAIATNGVAVGGGTINLSKGLTNAYFTRAGSLTQGKQAYQVIRVPQYANVTLTAGFNVLEWNGSTGGVLAMDAAGDINLNGQTITGTGRGFRGASALEVGPQCTAGGVFDGAGCPDYRATIASQLGGSKGEGSVGTPGRLYNNDFTGAGGGTVVSGAADGYVDGDLTRGAPGNAGGGGNQHNGGGGGGGNGGAGGNGGNTWNASNPAFVGLRLGGFGGAPSGNAAARWMMGGGGGAGDVGGNGHNQPDGAGGAGGALVILRASRLLGGGTITVNGAPGQRARLTDAAGGGGAGGTVVIAVGAGGVSGAVTVNANGGAGGAYQVAGNEQDGAGGGGGGGNLIHNIATGTVTFNAAGGAAGTTASNACPPTLPGADCGQRAGIATSGLTGYTITAVNSPGLQVGYECLPNLTVSKATTTPLISSATGATAAYTINVSNTGGGARFVSVRDWTLPPGWTRSATAPTYTFNPVQPLAADRLSSGAESVALTHSASWVVAATPLAVPTSGSNSLTWDHFAIAPIKNGVPGSVTISFVVSIPDTATASTYHNGAGIAFLDPTRAAAATRTVSPPTNVSANRTTAAYSPNTTYANYAGAASTNVGGNNYNGLQAGPTAEDVTLLSDLRLVKNTTTASVVAGRTTNFILVATNLGRALGSVTFAADQATTGSGTLTAGNPMNFVDNLQTGLSLASAPTSANANWSCTGGSGSSTFTCSAAPSAFPIARGATMTTVTATVNTTPSACPGPLIRNTATLALATIGESNTANNTATTSLSISCTTNLSITKDNGTTTLAAGQTTTYTVTISVAAGTTVSSADGAVARDTPSAGLANCSVTSCTPSGTPVATCPIAANWQNLLNGIGLPIPGLPAGSSVAFTVRCGVTATGLP